MIVASVLHASPKSPYEPRHVRHLRDSVERWCGPVDFRCLTNLSRRIEGVRRERLQYPWLDGWWAKLELFARDWEEPVLYLDLDTEIRGPRIRELLAFEPGPHLWMLDSMVRDPSVLKAAWSPPRRGSGVMVWDGKIRPLIADGCMPSAKLWKHAGDDRFITAVDQDTRGIQEALPGIVGSSSSWTQPLPGDALNNQDADVLCHHGKSRAKRAFLDAVP